MFFCQAASPGFPEPKLLLEHPEGMLYLGSDMSLGPLHSLGKLPNFHGALNALVACIPIDHLFLAMQ